MNTLHTARARSVVTACLVLLLFTAQSCAAEHSGTFASPAFDAQARSGTMELASADAAPKQAARSHTIRTGNLQVEVWNLEESGASADSIVGAMGGHVERRSRREDEAIYLTLRIPRDHFKEAVDRLSALGEVTDSNIGEQDVSEQYFDLEAKLTNLRALRDRLRSLLDRAKDVKDVVAVEEQLTRVQIELDQLEGQQRHLKSSIEMSTLHLTLERRQVPGPLGLVFYGAAWVIKKLFVLN